jgi:S-formylglutathione hydrolase FrmB
VNVKKPQRPKEYTVGAGFSRRALAKATAYSLFFVCLWFIPRPQPSLRFDVTTQLPAASGRLFVVIAKSDRPEPRKTIGDAGANASIIVARDVKDFQPGIVTTIDKASATFPVQSLDDLPPGDYYVQAVLATNRDLKSVDAPGNLYSTTQRLHLDPRVGTVARIELTKSVPSEELPPEDQFIKYVKVQSNLLTRFHGRPIYLRAGIILPRNYDADHTRFFPLRIHIGGYGTRYTYIQRLMAPNSEFRRMWLSDDAPRFIYLQLDGDGPYGDPYQINSDNSGPYGDALTRELIPYIEKRFRVIAEPRARVLDGESTGGWVSLALKIFYPDFFNAVWSSCPDGVDFRGFQLINIYNDSNAYFDENGSERPSKRDTNGNVEFTIRHECQMENVMGAGDSWTMSGQQWGAWNATYGPRGADGHPVPLWDPKTGVIDKSVVNHWKKYDLRVVLEQNWKTLGPELSGKIHISVGDADSYYLNNAVHRLDEFFKKAEPAADARIVYGAGRGHCWSSLSEAQMMKEMAIVVMMR